MSRVGVSTLAGYLVIVLAVTLSIANGISAYDRWRKPPTAPWANVSDWRAYAGTGHRIGPLRAVTTVVIFSDYECSVCAILEKRLRELREQNQSALNVVIRHFPLKFHRNARDAAMAAECAGAQARFLPYHEALFDHPDLLRERKWTTLASLAGVADTGVFSACVRDQRMSTIVDADVAAGRRLGVFGTPTILVNNEEYVGIPGDFEKIVRGHLKAAKQLP